MKHNGWSRFHNFNFFVVVLLALTQNNESFVRKKTKPKTNWFSLSKLKLNQKRTSLFFKTKTKPKTNHFSFLKLKLNQKRTGLVF